MTLNPGAGGADAGQMSSEQGRAARIRAFFAKAEDPYAGGDLATARRLGALLWVVAGAITWLVLPLSPPVAAFGAAGWLAAVACTVVGLACIHWIVRGSVTWDHLLVMSYVGLGQVAFLEWLAGGSGTPYGELYLLVVLFAGALHPPRRLAGVLVTMAALSSAPLVYEGASGDRLGQTGLRILLLVAAAMLATAVMRSVRAQRIGLRDRSDQAELLARIDELTGLPNRRAFREAIAVEISRARRFGSPLTLLIADLDGFKRINDVHGHQAGDECLRALGDILKLSLRQYDACFRWGGDEFALLLPETTADEAEVVARRVTGAVAACAAPDGEPMSVTCAPAQLDGDMTPDELVAAADAELLARKRGPGLRLAHSA